MKIFTIFTHPRRAALAILLSIWLIPAAYTMATIVATRSINDGLFLTLCMTAASLPFVAYIYSRTWDLRVLLVGAALATLILFLPPFTITTRSTTITQYTPPFGEAIWGRIVTNAALPPGTTDVPPADLGPSGH